MFGAANELIYVEQMRKTLNRRNTEIRRLLPEARHSHS
jgi:hypothetical protein